MKKIGFATLVACIMLLSACTPAQPTATGTPKPDTTLQIAATTWPVYCFTTAVTGDLEDVVVTPVVNEQMSCLHDYTLTVNSMKVLEDADVIVMNGVGLEDFMDDALKTSSATIIDSSKEITLLELDGGEDPHIWMDPDRAALMVQNIADGLKAADPDHAGAYQDNADRALDALAACAARGRDKLSKLSCRELITFHDGFEYFADTFDLTILRSIEEEEGSEASAKDINDIVALIRTHNLPAIFTEVNGSDATAQAIARETGVAVDTLSMIMSGDGEGLEPYLEALNQNINTIRAALSATEAAK